MALPTWFVRTVELALAISFFLVVLKIVYSLWIWPNMVYKKLRRNGLIGPSPSFPLGNIRHMVAAKNKRASALSCSCTTISHDIHSKVVPHFAEWQKSHGKVFIYWLGTEPFLRIADPEFLKQMASAVLGKSWGKPDVFKNDRKAMFGNGLVMMEGDDWLRHRSVITPAFSPANLKAMGSLIMVASTNEMLDRWTSIINSGRQEIEVESEIIATAGEIVAKTSFGMDHKNGKKVFHKLRTMQQVLFASNRYVGVPFNKFFCHKEYREAKRLGDEIDALFLTIIKNRIKSREAGITADHQEKNLLDLMLADKDCRRTLTIEELVDECKTFFFAGFETTALSLIWTLMLLAMYPEWQNQLRQEIKQVIGDQVVDATNISGLKKMGWVMSEALRLYPSAPNAQRQAREDIRVGEIVIPKGTNMWIDILSMNHDRGLWGDTVNEFRPERFEADSVHGGCRSKMGYVPFGFGGRMCIGRNLAIMEYKNVLTLILARFSFSLSPYYQHCPVLMLSLRPCKGLPLVFQPIN